MISLDKNHVIEHDNVLITAMEKLSVVEARFLAIYLSRINPKDIESRFVAFTLGEYCQIMGIEHFNIKAIDKSRMAMLKITLKIPEENKKYDSDGCNFFSLFSFKDVDGELGMVVDCNKHIEKYIFNLDGNFVKYRLGNITNLTEANHQQIYKFLKSKQHYLSGFDITFDELKKVLKIKPETKWSYFDRDVLKPCQKVLAEQTDIVFEYNPIKTHHRGNKIESLHIKVLVNQNFKSFESTGTFKINNDFDPFSIKGNEQCYQAFEQLLDCKLTEKQIIVLGKTAIELANFKYSDELDQEKITLDDAILKTVKESVQIANDGITNKYKSLIPNAKIKEPAAYLHKIMENELKELLKNQNQNQDE